MIAQYLGLLTLLLVACQSRSASETSEMDRPNIVLVIADDMNWDDCTAYGHPHIKTPNMERLAQEGMRFDHGYVTASSCSPSRASIMTGRYPHNTGAEQLHWPLPAGTFTIAEALKSNGYYTAASGKWHLGDHIRTHFDVINEANTAGFQLPSGSTAEPPKMIAEQPSGCEDWMTTLRSRPRNHPFFRWFAALDPHRAYEDNTLQEPHLSSDVLVPPYLPDVAEVREDLRQYYDEIGRLDAYLGQVLEELKQQGVEDNTLLIFISDNGRPFPRDKTTLYEGGVKTPWIVKWPRIIQPGAMSKSLVSAVDIAPTLAEIAGIDVPDDTFEGVSFLPVLKNPSASVRSYVFAEDHWHDYEDHARAVLNQDWKLIRNDYIDLAATPSADAGRSLTFQAMIKLRGQNKLTKPQLACFQTPRPRYELYHLKEDPYELMNLADDPSKNEIKQQLQDALLVWGRETNDYIPSRRTLDEFDRQTGQPDHSVRKRPRPDKQAMFGTYGKY